MQYVLGACFIAPVEELCRTHERTTINQMCALETWEGATKVRHHHVQTGWLERLSGMLRLFHAHKAGLLVFGATRTIEPCLWV